MTGFLNVTTSETKTGVLLIEVFRKPIYTQNYGHQGSILGGRFYNAAFLVNYWGRWTKSIALIHVEIIYRGISTSI
jgi:hypothetical protein